MKRKPHFSVAVMLHVLFSSLSLDSSVFHWWTFFPAVLLKAVEQVLTSQKFVNVERKFVSLFPPLFVFISGGSGLTPVLVLVLDVNVVVFLRSPDR